MGKYNICFKGGVVAVQVTLADWDQLNFLLLLEGLSLPRTANIDNKLDGNTGATLLELYNTRDAI